jgi:predicted  nucleic acid-binding Zn-ribbon protein
MKEGLQQLLELQQVDKDLQELEDAKQQYPAEINSRQREVELARKNLEELETKLEELSSKQRHFERELEVSKADLQEHEARFAEVTTNKEYDALQLEIEACKTRIADCETQILEAIETAEALTQQVETERQTFAGISQDQQELIDELQGKLATIQQEVDGVYSRREEYIRNIDGHLLKQYESSRRRLGTRVAPIRKGACGGCFRQLPAQQRSNVRRDDQIYYCENCGVILVWDDQSS